MQRAELTATAPRSGREDDQQALAAVGAVKAGIQKTLPMPGDPGCFWLRPELVDCQKERGGGEKKRIKDKRMERNTVFYNLISFFEWELL